jgi:hypothetical protein
MTLKEKANFVFKRRYLIVKRRENLTESERDDLIRMREYLPELAQLPQLGQNFTDFQVLFRRNSLFVGPTSSQTPM